MGKKPKSHSTERADGRLVKTKTYDGDNPAGFVGKKYFYGADDEEIFQKISAFERSLSETPSKQAETFKHYAEIWYDRKDKELSPSTMKGYDSHYKGLVEEFGSMPVDQISAPQIIAYLRSLSAQGYSQKLLRNRKSVLHGILDDAVVSGEIRQNPCVDLPEVKGKPAEKRPPASDDDLQKIEDSKTVSNFSRLFYFMEYTGCRRGEAVALQQKHIDRINKKARIEQAVVYRTQMPELKLPKTAAGIREVDLYDNVLEILPEYEDPETFVFFPAGLPKESALRDGLEKYRADYGIAATAHQLRHSYASMLHSANVKAKDAQQLLGHSSIVVTEDIYTSLEAKHKAELRDQINEYVMQERLGRGEKESCPKCGNTYLFYPNGNAFKYCPECGKKLLKLSKKLSDRREAK